VHPAAAANLASKISDGLAGAKAANAMLAALVKKVNDEAKKANEEAKKANEGLAQGNEKLIHSFESR